MSFRDVMPMLHISGKPVSKQAGAIMTQIGIKDIRDNLADALNRVAYSGERIVLARRGKGVAALVSMEDLWLLETLEEEADFKAAKKARKEKGAVSLADIKARLGMK